jgi:hypothetical protein
MSTQLFTERVATLRRSVRARAIASLGPLTMFGGVVWAFLQPHRITVLHPHDQGFWWLFVQPPLLAVAVGIVFALFVAPGLIEDLEDEEG